MVHDRKEPQAKGVQSTRFLGGSRYACRQWQTSEAQLSHRSRKACKTTRHSISLFLLNQRGNIFLQLFLCGNRFFLLIVNRE